MICQRGEVTSKRGTGIAGLRSCLVDDADLTPEDENMPTD
jgi:hypothetical protein